MKKLLPLLIVAYIASTAISYGGFQMLSSASVPTPMTEPVTQEPTEEETDVLLTINPSEPKDQPCPLNGQLFTKTEAAAWATRRPLAIMIENSPDSRPQSGVVRADVAFEAMAEGGVTRFMPIYYCDAMRKDVVVAPVRSARTYFIDWASGFNKPLYVHVGGANLPGPANALGQLGDYGWNAQNDLNQFSIGYPTFKRDYNRLAGKEVATEHTMVSSTEKLWEYAKTARKWTNLDPKGVEWSKDFKPWEFQDDATSKGTVASASFSFWDGFDAYSVKWEYDQASNSYKRVMAGEAHKDLESSEQIAVKNAVVLFSKEKGPIDELKHMLYQTTGTGTALVFQNGEAIEVNWSKPKRESQLAFTDKKGKPFKFVRGKIWISVVDVGTKVTY